MLPEESGSFSPDDEREPVDPLSFYLLLSLPLAMAGKSRDTVPNLRLRLCLHWCLSITANPARVAN